MTHSINRNGKDIEIKQNNIALYYNSMSDIEKIHFSHTILKNEFHDRFNKISEALNINKSFLTDDKLVNTKYFLTNGTPTPDVFNDGLCFYVPNGAVIEVSYFEIKDTLKPIDEYIAELKLSEIYKNYISNK